jgi:predicted CoA-binding protein
MDRKKIIILGASPDPARYSYMAAHALSKKNYKIVPVGLQKGEVAGNTILDIRTRPYVEHADTITIYMNPRNQKDYYEYVLSLAPRRIIFNPGAENDNLSDMAARQHIEVVNDCTLVMLRSGYF